MKMKRVWCVLFALSAVLPVKAWTAAERTVPCVYTNAQGKTLLYRFHAPAKVEAGKKYPLVVFFHGAGERGNDNTAQLVHGVTEILVYAEKTDQPLFLIAGQCPDGKKWVEVPWDLTGHVMPAQPSEPMALALSLVESVMKTRPVDASRVYVTGISMGGYGTWDVIQRRPNLFAAAMPICGGGDTTQAWRLLDLPIWAFHGSSDTTVLPWRSRSMVSAIWACGGGKIRYREYPGVGHNSWSATYADPDVLKWLFSNHR